MEQKKIHELNDVRKYLLAALSNGTRAKTRMTKKELDHVWSAMSRGEIVVYHDGSIGFVHGSGVGNANNNIVHLYLCGYCGNKRFAIERGVIYGSMETRTGDAAWTHALRTFLQRYGLYGG